MKKTIFDLIAASFSLFENPIYNYTAMTIIGLIAFKLAFGFVGKSELRGEAGSIVHWIIRFLNLASAKIRKTIMPVHGLFLWESRWQSRIFAMVRI